MDSSKRISLIAQKDDESEVKEEATDQNGEVQTDNAESFEQKLEEKITKNKVEKPQKNPESEITKYVVDIPTGSKLEQIHALKDFLATGAPGKIAIYILLSGKEIDTKFSIANIESLKKWEETNL